MYPVQLPFVLGVEGAGIVEALGPAVGSDDAPAAPTTATAVHVGDRVAYFGTARGGAYAGRSYMPCRDLNPEPMGVWPWWPPDRVLCSEGG